MFPFCHACVGYSVVLLFFRVIYFVVDVVGVVVDVVVMN